VAFLRLPVVGNNFEALVLLPGSTLFLPRSTASSFSTEPDISGAIARAVDAGSDDLTVAGSKVATKPSRCMNAVSTSQQEAL